jgi:Fibronectin type III domain
VGPTQELLVETTDNPDEVSLSWKHIVNKGEGAAVSFTATATLGNSKNAVSKIVTTDTHAILKGLNKNERYTFTVTASNSASIGRASVAVMQQTLSQISGNFAEQASGPVATVQVSAPPLVPTQTPVPMASPAPDPGPSTKTIYICPDGYTDTGSLCQKLLAYTFHDVTTTSPYTYHQQFVQTGSHITFTTDGSNGGTYYAQDTWNASDGSAAGFYAVIPDGYNTTVKDTPPTGFTDDGSKYTKTDKVKDSTPTGYIDGGTSWVTTTAKVTKVVPA